MAIALLAHLDPIPANTWLGKEEDRVRFLAERTFVHKVEASLPAGATVYNYPYSQYLSESSYYGWGAYGHIRLYMLSHALHWSNGSGKNTAMDIWHARQASARLLAEMAAVGFRGVVADRMVVGDEEYERFKRAAEQVGAGAPYEDATSRQAFFTLADPSCRLSYDARFESPTSLVVYDRKAFEGGSTLPSELQPHDIAQILANQPGT